MNVCVATLPKASAAIGGEDQAGEYLANAFEELGHQVHLFYEHERLPCCDLTVSYGAIVTARSPIAVYWHFNERVRPQDLFRLSDLGYTHVASSMETHVICPKWIHEMDAVGMKFRHLPLCADVNMLVENTSNSFQHKIAYVGNWNAYKGSAVDEWLIPFSDSDFAIYGGTEWKNHPVLSKNYRGIMPKEQWKHMSEIADYWLAFRSPAQVKYAMLPDRVYGLCAAGVHHIVSDIPCASTSIAPFVNWVETPQDAIRLLDNGSAVSSSSANRCVRDNHLFSHRIREIIDWTQQHA